MGEIIILIIGLAVSAILACMKVFIPLDIDWLTVSIPTIIAVIIIAGLWVDIFDVFDF